MTSGNNTVIITDNHPDFFEKEQDCSILEFYTKTNISFNGKSCGKWIGGVEEQKFGHVSSLAMA